MPLLGRGPVITLSPTPSVKAMQSFTLQTPTQGTPLFETFSNSENVILGLRNINPGPGVRITVSQGIIYLSVDIELLPTGPLGPTGPRGYPSMVTGPTGTIGPTGPVGTTFAGLVDVAAYPQLPPSLQSVPLSFVLQGKPNTGQVFNIAIAMAITIPDNFGSSVVYTTTPPTANAQFVVRQIKSGINSIIGTITLTAGSNAACILSHQGAVQFNSGDVLQLVSPVQDDTLSDISITIFAQRI